MCLHDWFYLSEFITPNSWLQQLGCDTRRWGRCCFLKPAITIPLPSCPPPSSPPVCFRSWGQRLDPATNQHPLRLHYPSKPSTTASNVRAPPGSFSRLLSHPRSLPLGPRLAPGRPVYVPLCRLLITTWMQAGKGLLRLGRQQKATDLQFTPAAHPPIPCLLGLELSPVWLRMERGTDVHSHAHVMPVHTFVCMSVQCVCVCKWKDDVASGDY